MPDALTFEQAAGVAPIPAAAPAPQANAAPTAADSGLAVNNPLNLRAPNNNPHFWPGQTGVSPGGFATFDTVQSGWEAADRNLLAKVQKHGLNTLRQIIATPGTGWAPAGDGANNPDSYVTKVSPDIGAGPDDDISQKIVTDPNYRHQVLQSMASRVEIGKPVVYGAGLSSAGGADNGALTFEQIANGGVPVNAATLNAHYDNPGEHDPKQPIPPDAQAVTFAFLRDNGFRDTSAPLGSSTNPAGQVPGQQLPAETNSWYVTPTGQLRQSGDETPDYVPAYQKIVSQQTAAANRPFWTERGPTALAQGAVIDPLAGANKMTGGLAFSNPTPDIYLSSNDAFAPGNAPGSMTDPQAAAAANSFFTNQQNSYDLLHGNDSAMALTRFGAQMLPATAAGMGTGAIADAAVAPLAASGNIFLRSGANLLSGAANGAGASAIMSGTSDRPLSDQIAGGALIGGAFGALTPAFEAAGNRLVTGKPLPTGETADAVTDLASTAVNKFGVPLRAGQIRNAAGNRAAGATDSVLLDSNPKYRANNDVQLKQLQKGLTSTYGDPSGDVSPEALTTARRGLGAVFDRVAANTDITDTDGLLTDLGQIAKDAQDVLPDGDTAPLLRQVQNIASTINDGRISGASYQALTRQGGTLDRLMASDNPNVAHYAGEIRDTLDDALQAEANPADAAALRDARFKYKNLMTVSDIAKNQDPVTGIVPFGQLNQAINRHFRDAAFRGSGDIGTIRDIYKTFGRETPNSGTAPRLAAMTRPGAFGLGLGLAGNAASMFFHSPETGLSTAAAGAAVPFGAAFLRRLEAIRAGPGAGSRLLNPPDPWGHLVLNPAIPSAVVGGNRFLPAPNYGAGSPGP